MPYISCIVGGYALQTVNLPGGSPGVRSHRVNKIGKGKRQFTQIGYFGRPVIHLDVDVYMIIGAPGWIETVGPYTLKVCREASRAGTAYKQVPSKLVVKLNQVGVVIAVLHGSYPGIGWEVAAIGRSQID